VAPSWVPSARQREREAIRRHATRRSALVAGVSTAAVLVAAAWATTSAPGWPRVRDTFFSWDEARRTFPAVLEGFTLNLRLFLGCGVAIVIIGMAIAVMRTLRGPVFFPLRAFGVVYTDIFRGVPLLLLLYLLGFGIPGLRLDGLLGSSLFWGATAIVLSYSAYVAEVFRAGLESIHPSQRAAARALGLSHAQSLRYVVVPQAVRRVMPALLNDLVSLTKDSGLIGTLGVVIDAIRAAQIETADSFNYTSYVVAGVLFILLTIPMARFTDWVARRQGFQGAGGVV
jgi:polar amino acid transport system permease protein